jgi:hypothetical protein
MQLIKFLQEMVGEILFALHASKKCFQRMTMEDLSVAVLVLMI